MLKIIILNHNWIIRFWLEDIKIQIKIIWEDEKSLPLRGMSDHVWVFSLSLQARNTCCPPAQHTTCSQHSLPWTDRSESLGQVNHFLKDKSEEQEMNKPDDDNEKVGDENIQVLFSKEWLWWCYECMIFMMLY